MLAGGHNLEGLNEAGGIFAGIVALLAAIGGGVRWLIGWKDRREESRAAKLQLWHEELKARELRLDADRENEIRDIRAEFDQMRAEHRALFQAYHLLARALIRIDPKSHALSQASDLLSAAFRIDPRLPGDMGEMLHRARRTGES